MIAEPADDYLVGSKRDAYAEYNSGYVFPDDAGVTFISHFPFL